MHDSQTETPSLRRLLRLPQVIEATGRTRSSLYADVRAGTFPKPHKIGPRAVAWDAADIARWQAERLASQA